MTARRGFIAQGAALAALPFISTRITRALAAASRPRLGFALCGLGDLSEHAIAPSLLKTQHCRLTGIITDSADKAVSWQKKYGIPAGSVYTYDTMARMADNSRATGILIGLLDEVRRLHQIMPGVPTHPPAPDLISEHGRILAAMEDRDADEVHRLVRDHIQASADLVMDAYRLAMG